MSVGSTVSAKEQIPIETSLASIRQITQLDQLTALRDERPKPVSKERWDAAIDARVAELRGKQAHHALEQKHIAEADSLITLAFESSADAPLLSLLAEVQLQEGRKQDALGTLLVDAYLHGADASLRQAERMYNDLFPSSLDFLTYQDKFFANYRKLQARQLVSTPFEPEEAPGLLKSHLVFPGDITTNIVLVLVDNTLTDQDITSLLELSQALSSLRIPLRFLYCGNDAVTGQRLQQRMGNLKLIFDKKGMKAADKLGVTRVPAVLLLRQDRTIVGRWEGSHTALAQVIREALTLLSLTTDQER